MKRENIKTPDDLIDYYTTFEGLALGKGDKKKFTNSFLKDNPEYTSEDIKEARLDNKALQKINSENVNNRYRKNVLLSKEKALNKSKVFTGEEIKLFKKLKLEGLSRLEIAEKLGRTYSSIEYLIKKLKKK